MSELERRRSAIGLLAAFSLTLITIWYRSGLESVDLTLPERVTVRFEVDVNHADRDELLLLPGVGPTIAERIISFRFEQGPFGCCDDLRQVHGIGPKTVERLRPCLSFGDLSDPSDASDPSDRND